MAPTVDRLTPGEQAEHYARLLSDSLPVLDRHYLGPLARRVLANLTREQFHHARSERLIKFADRIRRHGDLLNGVRIGRRLHRWASPLDSPVQAPRDDPDGTEMADLGTDLGRVLRGDRPLR
jgi:hypothetical protein